MAEKESPPHRILIVDDEESSREAFAVCLEGLGHSCVAVSSASAALAAANDDVFDLALVDLRLGADSGLDLITGLADQSPWLKVAVITAHGSIESAVEAIRRGAVDYVEKPASPPKLEALLRQISTVRDLERDVERLREDLKRTVPPPRIDTANKAMRDVYAVARRAAESDATVLIRGESGTGKGVLARAIHGWSPRRKGPFSTVNAPTLSRDLLESELFGHVKGAFTGAVRGRPGRLAHTNGGTLFLDEIGVMPIDLQPKLLRFIQERRYERVGSDKTREADVRMIVATNENLEALVEAGDFRQDLYFRIRVIEIHLPPLRERREDIRGLAERFAEFFGARYGRPGARITDAALRTLEDREWPGNVRELQNAVERAVILARGPRIGANVLPPEDDGPGQPPGSPPMITLDEAERRHIEAMLEATSSAKEAAKVLGVSTTTLWRRRRKHDL